VTLTLANVEVALASVGDVDSKLAKDYKYCP
jgi:hypothetical protein